MSVDQPEFTEVQFSASALWSRRAWIIVGAALGAVLALVFVFAQPQTNRSWAQVLVRPLGVDLTRGPVNIDRTIDTVAERELAGSFIVAERTADRLDTDELSPRELRREVQITSIDDSPVLEFSYADGNAELARDIAQAFAESYLEIRGEFSDEAVEASRQALQDRQQQLLVDRQAIVSARADLVEEEDRLANLSEETVVANQLAGVANDIALLDALTSDPGEIISPAQLAQRTERPRTVPMFLAGGVLGGLLATLAALFVDRGQRDRDLSDDDLTEIGLTPFAHLPRETRGADAFATLERRVAALMGENQVLAVTTVDATTTATQIAPWFAWNMAESGVRVLLISADFTDDVIAAQFGLPRGPGLTEALVGGSDPDEVVQRVGNLHVVTAGAHPGDPAGVLQMVGMTRLLNRARRVYDVVVIHAPDLSGGDSSLLASWAADAVALVVDNQQRNELQQAAAMLRRTDAELLGAVVLTPTAVSIAQR